MSNFVPDGEAFYNECMQEGNLVLYVHVSDHFGREAMFSDDILYRRDAWAIEYVLVDDEDEEEYGFRPAEQREIPTWYFIGVPVIPYTGNMAEVLPENVESEGWVESIPQGSSGAQRSERVRAGQGIHGTSRSQRGFRASIPDVGILPARNEHGTACTLNDRHAAQGMESYRL